LGADFTKLVLFLFLFQCLELPGAQAEGGARSALDRINADVEKESANLKRLGRQKVSIEKKLKELSAEIDTVREREEKLNHRLDELAENQASLSGELLSLEENIKNLELLSLRRLRALYMTGALDDRHMVFSGSSMDMQRKAFLLGKIRDFDQRLLQNHATLLQEKSVRVNELNQILNDQKRVRERLSEERRSLIQQASLQENLRRELGEQESRIQASVTALRAQALRLETVVVSLTASSGQPDMPAGSRPAARSASPAPMQRYDGPGLEAQKGTLQMPLRGKLLRGFGASSSGSDFSELVTSRGLLMKAPEAEAVSAIARGQVIHSGRMPGFGRILIVDHGERYYSLYGRLDSLLVERGVIVESGQRIASVSAADPAERSLGGSEEGYGEFYFEIRKDGLPVDPRNYLSWSFE